MHVLGKLLTVLTRSGQTFIWSAATLGLLILLFFFVVVAYESYLGTLQINDQAAKNIATLIEQDVARNIELYDLSLHGVIDGINDPDVMRQEPRLRQISLFDRSATAHGLGALVALDQNGSIVLDSQSITPRQGNFADREYFTLHRDSAQDIGLYISRPFRARLQGDIWSVSISRRINRPDGGFGGIVSGTVKLDYLRQIFDKVALGSGGSITLFRDDGTMIVRNVADDDKIGSDWSAEPVFAHLPHQTRGSFRSNRSMDGVPRFYAFQRIGQLPLVVAVGLSVTEVLAPWWSKILVLGGIFTVMVGSVLVLVWMLDAELRRRSNAERVAAALARTDGLTKLANRRGFDEVLSREWARGARDGRSLSLVMIDTDHFKRFNDTYGHQEGDWALAVISKSIAEAVRRPADLAARYGGEEFSVLLPNTDSGGAAQVANAIRDSINALRIPHSGSGHGTVTVSLGVATSVPSADSTAESLVRDADAALYHAKDQGRNVVCISNVVPANFLPRAG